MGGVGLYNYVPNPNKWTDPTGLTPCMGTPSLRGRGGTGSKYDPVRGQGLYVLVEKGKVKYVGRGDASARLSVHAKTKGKSHLEQFVVFNNNLKKAEANYLEQALMDKYGGALSTRKSSNLLNKIWSYSSSNPNSPVYDVAGYDSNWAGTVLSDALKKMGDFGL